MAGFKTEWTVTSGDLTITLPLTNNGTYNATVDWGDSSTSDITSYNDADRAHTYASAGTYEVEITGSCPGWSFANSAEGDKCTDIVDWGNSADFDGFAYLRYGFNGSAIASTGSGSILLTASAVYLDSLFNSCTQLTTVNSGLFDNATMVTRALYLFYGCGSVTSYPSLLYANMTAATLFQRNHTHNTSAVFPVDLFCAAADRSTWALNRTLDFDYLCYRGAAPTTKSMLPDLWKCDYGTGNPYAMSLAFAGSGNNINTAYNYYGVPAAWGGLATISDPSISALSDTTLEDGQSNVVITGATFCYNITKIELGDASTYAACTVLEEQTFDDADTTETSATIGAVVQGSLSDGNVWVYVTHYRSQTNSTGYAVTISSAGGSADVPLGESISVSGSSLESSLDVSHVTGGETISFDGGSIDTSIGYADSIKGESVEFSGGQIASSSAVSDVASGGQINCSYSGITGLSVVTQPIAGESISVLGGSVLEHRSITDTPTGESLLISGGYVDGNASSSTVDTLLGESLSIDGPVLSSISNVSDITGGESIVFTGGSINDSISSTGSDIPAGGSISAMGVDLGSFVSVVDSITGESATFSGADVVGVSSISDQPSGESVLCTGSDINGEASGVSSDLPTGGIYSAAGHDISSFSAISDYLSGYSCSLAGSSIDSNIGVSSLPNGEVLNASGGDLSAISSVSDDLAGEAIGIIGSSINGYSQSNFSDIPLGETLAATGSLIVGTSFTSDLLGGELISFIGADISGFTGSAVDPIGTIVLNNTRNSIVLNNNIDTIILNNNGGGV